MNSHLQPPTKPSIVTSAESRNLWFAVQTRSRHEKKIASQLSDKCITTFVPAVREIHRWTDRLKTVEMPLFPCYVFLCVKGWREIHQQIVRTPGVFQWVKSHGEPAQIPDSEIEAVRKMLETGLEITSYPFLKAGKRVRIHGGCLEGVEGILVKKNKDSRLFISINLIQRSMSIPLQGYELEPVS
jgi:transcription antitermination factor NusG